MNPYAVIDLTTFETVKESMGPDFIVELVDTYAEETPKILEELKVALNAQNFEGFRRAAHSIKSTSNSFGALKLGEIARELEYMGRDQNLTGAQDKVKTLEVTCNEVIQELQGLCHA